MSDYCLSNVSQNNYNYVIERKPSIGDSLDITADLLISILAHACTLSFIHVGLLLQTGFLFI